ncbi:fibronectin type III domain-containing protein [Micromonospora sp. C31]|uniref:fibronectin type III domain-containing protein n=1 Tax=Micromonospora sp. C31 TaxID=2824876 RepID=UPI001B38B20B|nr:fibronectin type III domain-containing protein [Micromonospora sp. C31]MBQ1074981.1 fibronectin type III domain-containing protein [Micromonospora sp. C31]
MSIPHRGRVLAALAVASTLALSAAAVAPAAARDPVATRPLAARAAPPSLANMHLVTQSTKASRPAPQPRKPAAPAAPRAARKGEQAVVTWKAPDDRGSSITGYVVTPYRNGKAQKRLAFDASKTSRKVGGLRAGGTYTFTVAAKNAAGVGPASKRSARAGILALPSAPTVISVYANSVAATLSWTPGFDGGSPVTNWVVTPYIGAARQASQTLGPATSGVVTGLTSGVTYRFTVAARTSQGTGPESALSPAVRTNVSPTLAFPTPPPGAVGVAYVAPLDVTRGVPPFVWSVESGSLPAGMTIRPNDGTLSGVPTTAGTYPLVVRVIDANGNYGSRRIVLQINQAPDLRNLAPPLAEVNAYYSNQFLVVGGTAPFSWSLAAGPLPPGLTLDPVTGNLTGLPSVAGSYAFTVRVTDAFGLSDTQDFRMVVQPASVVTLTADANQTTFGAAVTFNVTIGPGVADGTVTLIDVLPNGTDEPLGTFPVAFNAAEFQAQMPAFGLNTFRVQYDSDNTNAVANSNTVTIDVRAVQGQVLIGQFAQSGIAGPADQFVGIRNTTALNLPIAGFTIQTAGGPTVTIPQGARPLPPGRGYLVAAADYSLDNILPDLVVPSLGPIGGLRLVAPDVPGTVTDAAGSAPGFFEGSPPPAFAGPPFVTYAWVRLRGNGQLQDTDDTVRDFRLVSTVLGPLNGVPAALGSPSPQNSLGVYQQNGNLQTTLLDTGVASSAVPNREVIGNRLILRRKLTNRSTQPIIQARLRITALSQANGAPKPGDPEPPPPHGNLRLINPATPTSAVTLSDGDTVTVQNLRMDAPATSPPGGGMSTTLTIPLRLGGLGTGESINVALTFAVDTPGRYWVGWDIDALGGTPPAAASTTSASTSRTKLKTAGPNSAGFRKGHLVSGTVR